MKKFMRLFMIMAIAMVTFATSSCSTVPAGNVGVKFYLLGTDKGVDTEELSPGRYWIGVNEQLYLFPTFTQSYVWTKSIDEGSENDESIYFQDVQGLELNADVGIIYHVIPEEVSTLFGKYKSGIDEITDKHLRTMVRDAIVRETSTMKADSIYGSGKSILMDSVLKIVREEAHAVGIAVDKLSWLGNMRIPKSLKAAINSKIEATQRAQQRENELREATAQKNKDIEKANGKAESILIEAEAQAEANKMLSKSLTPQLIQAKAIEKWNGIRPTVEGGSGSSMIFDVSKLK